MALGLYHYQLLSDMLEKIHFIYDEKELSSVILEALSRSLNTEAGTIFRIAEQGRIMPTAAYGASLDLLQALDFSIGKGVVGWVAQYTQPVKVDNPQSDQRFMLLADAVTGFKTRSIIASPIMVKGKTVGVLEFINKKNGAFTIPDLELISMVGRELGIAFENVRLIGQLSENNAYLKSIVGGLGAGLLVMDPDQNVVIFNARARELLGAPEEAALGERPAAARVAEKSPEFLKLMLSTARAGKLVPRGQLKALFNQKEMVLGYSATPAAGIPGKPGGMTFLFQDITVYAKKQA